MKRILAIPVLCMAVALAVSTQAKDVPNDVQQTLISLDKQWGEAGATLPSWTKSSAPTCWLSVPRAKPRTSSK